MFLCPAAAISVATAAFSLALAATGVRKVSHFAAPNRRSS